MAKKCLIVDDVEVSRYATSIIFEDLGFTIIEATDGNSCLEALAARPDVILLDWHLRKESGLDLIARIRGTAAGAATPIIVYSGVEKAERVAEVSQAGAAAFITKPATQQQVEVILKSLNLM